MVYKNQFIVKMGKIHLDDHNNGNILYVRFAYSVCRKRMRKHIHINCTEICIYIYIEKKIIMFYSFVFIFRFSGFHKFGEWKRGFFHCPYICMDSDYTMETVSEKYAPMLCARKTLYRRLISIRRKIYCTQFEYPL